MKRCVLTKPIQPNSSKHSTGWSDSSWGLENDKPDQISNVISYGGWKVLVKLISRVLARTGF